MLKAGRLSSPPAFLFLCAALAQIKSNTNKMKKSKINIEVTLDEQNIPEDIQWSAEDAGAEQQKTKSISIGIWDEKKRDTLMLDLWTKDMNVDEMKQFHINLLGSSASTLLSATGDEFMSSEISNLCEKLVQYLSEK